MIDLEEINDKQIRFSRCRLPLVDIREDHVLATTRSLIGCREPLAPTEAKVSSMCYSVSNSLLGTGCLSITAS